MAKYIDLFENNESIINNYDAPSDALKGATVYIAWYSYEDYSGYSWVLFKKGGKLYEVNGSHCSCYGLEGQWTPEETSWEALSIRNYDNSAAQEELTRLVKKHLGKPVQKADGQ